MPITTASRTTGWAVKIRSTAAAKIGDQWRAIMSVRPVGEGLARTGAEQTVITSDRAQSSAPKVRTGGGPPRGRRLRSPSPVADTAVPEAPRPDRTRSQSTTHPKGPTTRLTAPAYWKFESISLQQRVRCEPVSRENSPSYVEKPRFPAGVGAGASGAVDRDAQGPATSRAGAVVSLSGDTPVPQCRRGTDMVVTGTARR